MSGRGSGRGGRGGSGRGAGGYYGGAGSSSSAPTYYAGSSSSGGGNGGGSYGGARGGYQGGRRGGYGGDGRDGGSGGRGGYGGGARGGYGGGGGGGRDGGGRGRGRGGGRGGQTLSLPPLTEADWTEAAGELHQRVVRGLKLDDPTLKADRPPKRPGFGKIGTRCVVRANHFLVQAADSALYHYDVSFTPDATSKNLCREIITKLVNSHGAKHFGSRIPAYDGRKSFYTAGALPFESKDFEIDLGADVRRESRFKVTIKLVATLGLDHLKEFIAGRELDAPHDTIQVLDVALRSASFLNDYIPIGRSFFCSSIGSGSLGNGLEYWRGYYQSLRPTQLGLSLNIDTSAQPFFKPMQLVDFVEQKLGRGILSRSFTDRDRLKLRRELKGLIVETNHGNKPRRYKIVGLSVEPAERLMFTTAEAEKSVADYFREKYEIRLRFPKTPCVQAGSKKNPASLPMEVCTILVGQKYGKKLDPAQVTALLKATCQRPRERENVIMEAMQKNNYNADQLVSREFGITVATGMTSVEARVLPPPMLRYYSQNGQPANVAPQLGTWNMIDKIMYKGGTVKDWLIISFSNEVQQYQLEQFSKQLVSMCQKKGMDFAPRPVLDEKIFGDNDIERALSLVYSKTIGAGKKLQLLLIVLPDGYSQYGKIKRICETEHGLVTQCCKPKHVLSEPSRRNQYLENVALKINVKAGGANTILHDAASKKIPIVTDRPTIIFGADVTHPQPGEDCSASIAAVVASMDWPGMSKYKAHVCSQGHREEIIQDLKSMVAKLLHAFDVANKGLPDVIIFYRDGVSDGQFAQVLLHEMDAIRSACQSLKEGYLPRVTFIVVQKRHHTRFFPAEASTQDRNGNALPGTVVDTQICHPSQYDFFLSSHAGIQGTNRPTHYHVLFDENYFSADLVQLLTNSLCYTFARCTRSVSVAPPAYYAHLAAFRARYYVERDISEGGSTSAGSHAQTRDPAAEPRTLLPAVKANVEDVMFYC